MSRIYLVELYDRKFVAADIIRDEEDRLSSREAMVEGVRFFLGDCHDVVGRKVKVYGPFDIFSQPINLWTVTDDVMDEAE